MKHRSLALALVAASTLLLLPGRAARAVPVDELASAWKRAIPRYYSSGYAGEFRSRDGKATLRYRYFPSARERGAIVFLTGQAEPILKYGELFYDLRKSGYSVYAMDHRGQGASERLPGTAPQRKGYVDRFQDYVDDLDQLMSEVVVRGGHSRIFLLAHSMGGAVSTLYLAQHPGVARAAALSSPMYEILAKPLTPATARVAEGVLVTLGQGKAFAPGKSRFNQPKGYADKTNVFNGCKPRFEQAMALGEANPDLFLNGPTNRWVQQALAGDARISKTAGSIATPILLFQAGRDQVVNTKAHDRFVAKQKANGKAAELLRFPDAAHEILVECDGIRGPAIAAALGFFDEN